MSDGLTLPESVLSTSPVIEHTYLEPTPFANHQGVIALYRKKKFIFVLNVVVAKL